jgi:hypothetical protein
MNLEQDEQTEALLRDLSQIIDNDLPIQSPDQDAEGDPRENPPGPRARAAAPSAALRAAEQGTIRETG